MMGERTFSSAELQSMLDTFVPLMKLSDGDPLADFTMPVGPETSVRVMFDGPVDAGSVSRLCDYLKTLSDIIATRSAPPVTSKAMRDMIADLSRKLIPPTPEPAKPVV